MYPALKITEAQWRFLFDLWRRGYRLKELGDWVGASPNTIRYHFVRLGLRVDYTKEIPPLETYQDQYDALGGEDDL